MSTYPGVYISEISGLSLGAAGMSGLVPLLVGSFYNKDGTAVSLDDGPIYISGMSDFSNHFLSSPLLMKLMVNGESVTLQEQSVDNVSGNGKVKKIPVKQSKSGLKAISSDYLPGVTTQTLNGSDNTPKITLIEENLNHSAIALASYFNNGGGACWILSLVSGASGNDPDKITSAISEYSDISLLASIGKFSDESAVNNALVAFIADNQQSFLIMKAEEGIFIAPNVLEKERTAAYTPDLVLNSTPLLHDEGIFIKVGTDGYRSVAALKDNPGEYAEDYKTFQTVWKKTVIDSGKVRNPVISPVSAVAGAYCASERARGIWKAPANISLVGVTPKTMFNREEHGKYNNAGINAIMWRPSSGTTIMGARTLEEPAKTAWRYVPVRMLFNTVERDVRNMLSPVVFEPNSATTWQAVIAAISNYLYLLWKKGGLYGVSEMEAYKVGMALEEGDIDKGVLRVSIGMAALRPVEFIYLEFSQDLTVTA